VQRLKQELATLKESHKVCSIEKDKLVDLINQGKNEKAKLESYSYRLKL